MSKPKKPKARKAPPPTVLWFVGADGEPVDMPTAEAIVQQIEQAAQLKVLADAEFEWQLAHGSQAEANAAKQRALAAAAQYRAEAVRQLQSIIDTAMHHHRTVEIAEQRSAQTRFKAGDPARQQFALALAAVAASGEKLTATTVLNHWPPDEKPLGVRRVQILLEEHKTLNSRPPDEVH